MKKPLVSVIVPTKNSSKFLALCLHYVEHQEYPRTEIIIVDNYSKDDTHKIASKYTGKFFTMGFERARQDNYGIKQAKGEIIWLTGSDLRADLNYIKNGVRKIQEGYDAIYSSVLTDWRVNHFWGRVKALERQTFIGDNTIESARFFKKSVWEKLGGFDEKLVQVEEDFQHRLDSHGYKTGRISSREYHLHEDKTLKEVFGKSCYYGTFMRHYLSKHKQRGIKQLFPIRRCYLRNWKLFTLHPILILGFVVYKIVQYAGGLCGMRRLR